MTAEPYRAKTGSLLRTSILFRPQKPSQIRGPEMVETPGTAPGSVTSIPRSVYRHSRLLDALYIGGWAVIGKGLGFGFPMLLPCGFPYFLRGIGVHQRNSNPDDQIGPAGRPDECDETRRDDGEVGGGVVAGG